MTTLPADELVERLARAWASIDGEADQFDLERANPNLAHDDPHYHGAYDGYLAEADELLRRSGLAAEISSLRVKLAEAQNVLWRLARLKLPDRPRGNAGIYSIFHDDIRAARRLVEENGNEH